MSAPATLAIAHVETSSPPAFILTRLSDGKSAAPVTISSPYQFPVESQPNSNLMDQLRWYLEHFLDYPFDPEIGHAERVLDALQAWGTEARPPAGDAARPRGASAGGGRQGHERRREFGERHPG